MSNLLNSSEDIFYDVPGYEGFYQITKSGIIKSLPKLLKAKLGSTALRKEKNLRGNLGKNGYRITCFTKDGIKKYLKVHRLLAITFIPNPDNLPHINHINGIKTDNNLENLEWITLENNAHHAREIGLYRGLNGEQNTMAILTDEIVKEIYENKCSHSIKELAQKYKVTRSNITCIRNGNSWSHITGKEWTRAPLRRRRRYAHDGKRLTVFEWSKLTGINANTLLNRFKRPGWTIKMALTLPLQKNQHY